MSLSVSTIGDNTSAPFARAETYVPDQLIAGNLKLVTQPVIISSGVLSRGTVLGQVSSYSVEVAKGATNAGNGTVGSISTGPSAKIGAYTLTATSATNFNVTDPEGNALAAATVGTAYASNDINFTITAGATAFSAGDTFSLTVVNAIGTFIESVKMASDGSQTPVAILVDNVDASAGPVATAAYVMGEFNARALIFDPSWTIATLTTALRPYGIFVKTSLSAADPS
ncbi:head decoration protein [Burkholderia contaminans]|uniref:head decoration protein n=1 Tax=Burkholderia TaxID=32008 RepID=UPI0010F571EB|nr:MULTISPECIES: head decoration protein [Burkholderia]MBD1412864.1 head decoration protein [Burkholderia contaminans]UXZ68685.1 head decoration protein [Burkholderia contaminans]UXZ76446.1 head decoration protein [Burkholderia contaminans]